MAPTASAVLQKLLCAGASRYILTGVQAPKQDPAREPRRADEKAVRNVSRRRLLQIVAVTGAGGLWAWRIGRAPAQRIVRTRAMMGTTVHLTVVGENAAAAAGATLARMAELEGQLTRHRTESEVGRLNAHGFVAQPSAALLDVLALAREMHTLGDGAFDVTMLPLLEAYRAAQPALPDEATLADALARVGQHALRVGDHEVRFERPGMSISLDGVGKGYIVDEGVAVLKRHGFSEVLVEAGGDLMATGRRWRIGVRDPRASQLMMRIGAQDVAVATSGDYFQPFTRDLSQHHILDPRTGRSSPELASATVMAPTAARADALATLAMALGTRRTVEIIEELAGCEACLVAKDSGVTRTSGFPS